jgi:potassium channel subfamily K
MHLNLEALTGAQLEAAALEAGVPLNTLLPPGFKVRCASEGVRRNSRLSGMFVRGRGATEEPKKNGFGVNFADSNANPVPGGSNPNPNQSLQLQLVPSNTNSLPLTHARLGRMITMLGSFALAMDRSGRFTGDNPMKAPSAGGKDAGGDADARTPGFKKSLSQEYDEHRGEMESEETKAFYARLTVAWTLFLVFWTVCLTFSPRVFGC